MITTTAYLKWLRRAFWLGTGVYWVGLFVLTHTPLPPPLVIVKSDKTAHFWGHGLLAAAVFTSLRLAGRRDPMLAVLLIGFAYGAIDEWLQIPIPGRSCELVDWFADIAGVAVAATLGAVVTRWHDARKERSSW
jgi:VanZ family protein